MNYLRGLMSVYMDDHVGKTPRQWKDLEAVRGYGEFLQTIGPYLRQKYVFVTEPILLPIDKRPLRLLVMRKRAIKEAIDEPAARYMICLTEKGDLQVRWLPEEQVRVLLNLPGDGAAPDLAPSYLREMARRRAQRIFGWTFGAVFVALLVLLGGWSAIRRWRTGLT